MSPNDESAWDLLYADDSELESNKSKLESNPKEKIPKSKKLEPNKSSQSAKKPPAKPRRKSPKTNKPKKQATPTDDILHLAHKEILLLEQENNVLRQRIEKLESNFVKKTPGDPQLESKENSFPGVESDPKILDIDTLWRELCELRDDFTVGSLILWLAKISRKSLSELDPSHPKFYRTKPSAGIIKLFRHLKKEGYV